jgi:hypothetical protein
MDMNHPPGKSPYPSRDSPHRPVVASRARRPSLFDTWRSLAHVEGLDDAGAADLMVDLARSAAAPEA